MPDCNLCKLCGFLTFTEDYFGQPTAHCPAKVNARKFPETFEAQSLNCLSGVF
jgi:hypothetical protein